MSDYTCIDISPDTHVRRVFKRLGVISKNASNDELIYSARELNPEYPGIFDLSCWEIGRNWCKLQKPQCEDCYLHEYCPKKIWGESMRKQKFSTLWRTLELLGTSCLTLAMFGSYNTGYTARFIRQNSAKDGTSYSPKTLSEINIYLNLF